MARKIRACGFDPGTNNFGVGVIDVSMKSKVSLVEFASVKSTVKNLTSKTINRKTKVRKEVKLVSLPFTESYLNFYNVMSGFIRELEVTDVTIERFQSRGLRGKTIECVAMMNSAIALYCISQDIPITLHVASTWKNAVGRLDIDLEKVYVVAKKHVGMTPHETDATIMSLYTVSQKHEELNFETCLRSLIKNLKTQ